MTGLQSLVWAAVVLGAVSAFHLQSQPDVINRVCTVQYRAICSQYGMRCRANQAFDADMPHAVCDRVGQRTAGIRPEQLQMRMGRGGGGGQFSRGRSFNRFDQRGGDFGGFGSRGWASPGGQGQWETAMW